MDLLKRIAAVLTALALTGCTESYSDLESAFGVEKLQEAPRLNARTIVLTSQRHGGAESYRNIATIYVSDHSIGIEVAVPFTKSISIPVEEVAGCGMTCFGTDDQHVDLLIPKAGVDLMIARSEELLDWCWKNKRPMFPSSVRREWQYKLVTLPPASKYSEQLASRDLFDKQTKQSCLGY